MTVVEQNLSGADDQQISEICKNEDRVLVILDLDFADMRTYPPGEYPGIIIFRVRFSDKKNLLTLCSNLLPILEREQLSQRLWIVEESRIRIRGEES